MEDQRTALDTLYFVNGGNTPITLEIITGGINQTSTIHVKVEGLFDKPGIKGHLNRTPIGTNQTLNGKNLLIACSIADTSRETNYTELIVRINGGLFYKEYVLYATVENEGDVVSYACIIRFFKPF